MKQGTNGMVAPLVLDANYEDLLTGCQEVFVIFTPKRERIT